MKKMTRVNGIYRVGNSNWGYSIMARDLADLFPKDEGRVGANVLLYTDRDSLETERFGRHLVYAMSLDRYFRVGVTVHPDVDISKDADVIFTRFRLNEDTLDYSQFYEELQKSEKEKIVFTEERQARDFAGKTIDEIVRLVKIQALARNGN